jgi:lantibiotic modifying enzyme
MAIRALALVIILSMPIAQIGAANRPYLAEAIKAANWIEASSIKTGDATAWPVDPRDPKSIQTDLYSGVPGVVLFWVEAYRSTGDRGYLQQARAGADYLLADLSKETDPGLYSGVGGIGFVLIQTYKVTLENKYRQGAVRCLQLIKDKAIKTGSGLEWNNVTDIISGGAGIGLFLLYAARELDDAPSRQLAVLDGKRLIELGMVEGGGLKWAMSPEFKALMPNFSHGTAGVCYFLATLYQETKQKEFLDAALAGTRYLQSIADTENNVCLIFHDEPNGKSLYYLGWCHGPVGTTRLFYRLYQVTGDPRWMDWVKKAARGIMQSGIPEKLTPGFWNNVSQCCGSAGVAEFFLNLYEITHDRHYLEFSKRVTANLLSRATAEKNGVKWIQAEHRVKPDLLLAQTGYMQGAAGIGMWLLHLDAFERGKRDKISFPDDPFHSN